MSVNGAGIRVRGIGSLFGEPTALRVVVDGTATAASREPVAVEPGVHSVRVQGPAFRSSSVQVSVRAGEVKELELRWTRSAAAGLAVFLGAFGAALAAAVLAPDALDALLERGGVATYVVTAAVVCCAVVACAGETRALREVPPGSPERLLDRAGARLLLAALPLAIALLGGPRLLLRARVPRFTFNHGELRGRTPYRRLCVEDHAAGAVAEACWVHREAALAGEMKVERWKAGALPGLEPGAWSDAGFVDVSGRRLPVRVRAKGARFPNRDLLVDVEQPYVSYRFESTIGWKEGTPPAAFEDIDVEEHKRVLSRFFAALRIR